MSNPDPAPGAGADAAALQKTLARALGAYRHGAVMDGYQPTGLTKDEAITELGQALEAIEEQLPTVLAALEAAQRERRQADAFWSEALQRAQQGWSSAVEALEAAQRQRDEAVERAADVDALAKVVLLAHVHNSLHEDGWPENMAEFAVAISKHIAEKVSAWLRGETHVDSLS